MSESGKITLYEGTTPATPPAGSVVLYPKVDGRFYFKASDGIEYPMRSLSTGLLADGSEPLTADWNAGLWKITANQLESVVVTGTAPFIVASTTVVANLNADLLDGQEGSYYASVTYVDNSIVGLFEDKGNYDAATNTPDLDTAPSGILKGYVYTVSVAGVFFTANVEVGDVIRAMQDSPTILAHWAITQTNLDAASVEALYNSAVPAASQVEMETGTGTAIRRMTPERIAQAIAALGASGGGLTVEFKTTSFTAVAGYKYFISPAAALVVTLPAGVDLDNIQLRPTAHNAATFNITINPDGTETIDDDTTFVIDLNEGGVDIAYKNADTNWEVSAYGGGVSGGGGGWADMTEAVWAGGTQSEVVDGASAVAFAYDTDATYSTAGAKLASWSNNSVEKAYIDKDGDIVTLGTLEVDRNIYGDGRLYLWASNAATSGLGVLTDRVSLQTGKFLSWSSTNDLNGAPDVKIYVDAAATLAQRNSTNAQTYNIYSTWTDASNYERLAIGGDGSITAETAGTGTDNIDLTLTPAGTGDVAIAAGFKIAADRTTEDAAFINFKATEDADATSAISTNTTSGGTTHHIQIEINGVTAWIACSTTDPT